MPLPPALLARLKKKGIVTEDPSLSSGAQADEEIIAESYDDDGLEREEERNTGTVYTSGDFPGCPQCPNRSNVFHRCTQFCWERWGGKKPGGKVDPVTERRRLRMLRHYPLPEKWEEVFDVKTSRYYYWNTESDEVSWLSPTHPKAVVTLPASRLATSTSAQKKPKLSFGDTAANEHQGASESEAKKAKRGGRKSPPSDVLDPMDPAAYSDTPRGTWSSGLERGDEAKTGVDTTASGPLFQMRPYPAPGAILRRNAEKR